MMEILQDKAKQMPLETLTLLGLRLSKKEGGIPCFHARLVISAKNDTEHWMANILTWDDAAEFIKDLGGILLVNKYSAKPHDTNGYYNNGALWERNPSLAALVPYIEGGRLATTITIGSFTITINGETYETTFNINADPKNSGSPTIADIKPDVEKKLISNFLQRRYNYSAAYVSKLMDGEYPPVQNPVAPPDNHKIICHCDCCDEDIFDDEEYYIEDINGEEKIYCENCFVNKAATICLQAGIVKSNKGEP